MSTRAWPDDVLPDEVVEFRRRMIDTLWDRHRFKAFGIDDPAVSADGFCGHCLQCGGPLHVRFDDHAPSVEPLVCIAGHDVTERAFELLELARR